MNENERVQIDFTIVDPYGNMNHICQDKELYEDYDDGLEEYCEAFRLLLVQAGYLSLEGKEIKFVDKE